ncbi:hypothetical protein MFFDBJGM_04174 [Pectobacterium versatile]|nr:hypothetical protein MFFDBJGM_04174 [Pectobacterium versatile]GKV81405.1 hypothetical protein PEC106664_21790 [Pectobacterium carotovorum subsp. carotovorum]
MEEADDGTPFVLRIVDELCDSQSVFGIQRSYLVRLTTESGSRQ